ncbi:3'-5' exonuclease [Guyparkeria hydrothermalis]|uniref:3'-5' exonuclease n=1 Tax=Guyparkeria hydrothermalis TaxID=923 RepID=UPI0020207F3E|nr:3'-5' exonuclease [Guyparkeria hydrothermalis]MCL7743998.1 3'-5' exonuclease [Guyparkeria hydrothermalis]
MALVRLSWFPHATWLKWRRRRQRALAGDGSPLAALLDCPLPDLDTDWTESEYVVLDFETTGLDPRNDRLLSAGFVVMRGPTIDLSTAEHGLIRPDMAIPEASAVIHRITDDRAATGRPEREVLAEVLEAMSGRVLVAHNARFEIAFLSAACRRHFGAVPVVPVIDTLQLARRGFERRHLHHGPGELRLDSLRNRYHLPRYHAHHALVDALGTAELFSALCQDRVAPEGHLGVRELLVLL